MALTPVDGVITACFVTAIGQNKADAVDRSAEVVIRPGATELQPVGTVTRTADNAVDVAVHGAFGRIDCVDQFATPIDVDAIVVTGAIAGIERQGIGFASDHACNVLTDLVIGRARAHIQPVIAVGRLHALAVIVMNVDFIGRVVLGPTRNASHAHKAIAGAGHSGGVFERSVHNQIRSATSPRTCDTAENGVVAVATVDTVIARPAID